MRVVPPPIELVDWDAVEGKGEAKASVSRGENNGSAEGNGDGKTLFD